MLLLGSPKDIWLSMKSVKALYYALVCPVWNMEALSEISLQQVIQDR